MSPHLHRAALGAVQVSSGWPSLSVFRLRAHRYRQPDHVLSAAYARLQAAYPIANATTVAAYDEEAVWLAQHLLAAIEHKKTEIARLQGLFRQHSDHATTDRAQVRRL